MGGKVLSLTKMPPLAKKQMAKIASRKERLAVFTAVSVFMAQSKYRQGGRPLSIQRNIFAKLTNRKNLYAAG